MYAVWLDTQRADFKMLRDRTTPATRYNETDK